MIIHLVDADKLEQNVTSAWEIICQLHANDCYHPSHLRLEIRQLRLRVVH